MELNLHKFHFWILIITNSTSQTAPTTGEGHFPWRGPSVFHFRKGPLRRRVKKRQFILLKGGLPTSWPSANQLIGLFNTNYTVVPNNRMVNSSGLPWSSSNNSLQC